jgi:hypothetical protein
MTYDKKKLKLVGATLFGAGIGAILGILAYTQNWLG